MRRSSAHANEKPVLPEIPFQVCPIRASLGCLGRKWALLLLRDIGFLKLDTFSEILRNNPGLTPRVLSMRLRDLQREGILERVVGPEDPRDIRYWITPKGKDVLPVLTALIQFGIRHHADRVFEDRRARDLRHVFPERQEDILGRLASYARDDRPPR